MICLLWGGLSGEQAQAEGQDEEFEEEFELIEESQQIYSAAKHVQDISDSPAAVTVITAQQIHDSHCTTMACILRMVPEVEVRHVLPMFHAVGARALAGELADKAMVLLDGREINNEIFGLVFWAGLPVHLEEIERIEVIRGPGSALYGANAHSLVVSITTRRPESSGAQVFSAMGERGRLNLMGRADGVWGGWRLSLTASHERADNWNLQGVNEGRFVMSRAILEHGGDDSRTRLDLGLTRADMFIYTGLLPAWWRDLYLGHALLEHRQGPLQGRLVFNVLNGVMSAEQDIKYQGIKLCTLPDFSYFNPDLNAEVQVDWSPFAGNLFLAGANYRWIAMYANNNDPQVEHEHRVGVFFQDEQRLFEKLLLTAGLRLDYNSITPFTVSPRGAAVWHVAESQQLRFSAGQAFRKPSFMNTSFHFTGIVPDPAFLDVVQFFHDSIGNRGLGNESITVYELGYRGAFFDDLLQVEAECFYNRYRDTITFISNIVTGSLGTPDLGRSVMRFENQGRDVDSLGGSISLAARPLEGLRLFANYTFRYSWYVTDPLSQAIEGIAGRGDRVPWEPAHLANFGGSWRFGNGLAAGFALYFRSSAVNNLRQDGELFGDILYIDNPARLVPSAWFSWGSSIGAVKLEAGVKAFDIFNVTFRDTVAATLPDGTQTGGELLGRQVVLFLRGEL